MQRKHLVDCRGETGYVDKVREVMKVAGVREEDAEDKGDGGGRFTVTTPEGKSCRKSSFGSLEQKVKRIFNI